MHCERWRGSQRGREGVGPERQGVCNTIGELLLLLFGKHMQATDSPALGVGLRDEEDGRVERIVVVRDGRGGDERTVLGDGEANL